jgi:G:T-mismatch repair DNA endonuclease (very short patch repair protein)/predicted nucleic acid-binding Zn ribbon protein
MIIPRPLEENLNKTTCTEKYIKSHYNEFYQYILNNYPEELTWSEKLYWYYHNITTHPTCPVCGKDINFISFNKGYQKYCSRKCSNNNDEKKSKIKQTCLKKYGVEHPAQSKKIQNKTKQTCLERYGVENPFQSESVKDKIRQTNLKKYGIDYPMQSPNIQQKSIQTCLEKYGVDNPNKSQEIRNKTKQTCLEKYGVKNPMQFQLIKDKLSNIISSEIIQHKTIQTCLDRYGVEYASQSDVIRDKIKQTCLERYGVENYTQSKEGRTRLRSILSSDEIQTKVKQTCLERYGVENYNQSEEGRARLSSILSSDEIQTKINNTKRLNRTFNSSEIESLFSKYLDSQNIEYKRQYRSKEYPFNCDFYLPKYDLYIEIQASWTHGGHPYNEETDKDILEKWKSKNTDYYNNAIETWTERDVKKREIAKQNHLKYLEIFSNDIDCVIKDLKAFEFSISKT